MHKNGSGIARNIDFDQAARYKLKIALHFCSNVYVPSTLERTPLEKTRKVCSSQGYFELMGVGHSARSGGIIGISSRFSLK